MLVDTHCHLDLNSFDIDREAVLDRALEAGIIKILNPGIDINSSRKAVTLSDQNEQVYAAVGIHPNDALTWDSESWNQLQQLAKHPKVVAIGEIGLDYYRDYAPRDLQRRIFVEQLSLARDLGLPVVIHNRNATIDILIILTEWKAELQGAKSPLADKPGVLHSFSEDLITADRVIELGFFIGFTGPVTFRKADMLRQVAAAVRQERILIETDAPFLTPQPHRGKRNEPAFVKYVAETVAELHELSLNDMASVLTANAKSLFNW